METYECALSGMEAKESDLVNDAEESDALADLPLGWLKITVQRRIVNPMWEQVQIRKHRMLRSAESQIPAGLPEHDKNELLEDAAMHILATFSHLDSKTPKYITLDEEVYISDPSADPQLQAAWDDIGDALGLDILVSEDADENTDAGGDAAEEEDDED